MAPSPHPARKIAEASDGVSPASGERRRTRRRGAVDIPWDSIVAPRISMTRAHSQYLAPMSHSLTVRSASRPRRLRPRREEATMEVEQTTEETSSEPMDLMAALQMVLKKALAEDGLHRGLREACKVRIRRSTVPRPPGLRRRGTDLIHSGKL